MNFRQDSCMTRRSVLLYPFCSWSTVADYSVPVSSILSPTYLTKNKKSIGKVDNMSPF